MASLPFFNRELSWIEFNARVLNEACQEQLPVLERLKFLAIVSSNYDEFFMVRVSTIKSDLTAGDVAKCPSGMCPSEILDAVSVRTHELVATQYCELRNAVLPKMAAGGMFLPAPAEWSETITREARSFFDSEIFPALTTIAVSDDVAWPPFRNMSLHIAVLMHGNDSKERLAIIPVPSGLGRFRTVGATRTSRSIILLEDIITQHVSLLFPGMDIQESTVFRFTRDADMGVDEDSDQDFVGAMSQILTERQQGQPVRLEIAAGAARLRDRLCQALQLEERDIYDIDGPINLTPFMDLTFTSGFGKLSYEKWGSQPPEDLNEEETIWESISKRDVLLHHPYESFDPVVDLLRQAAVDPGVIAIKMTLYRTSGDSAVIDALIRAAENGKQVVVLVELKARFDEERNILRADQLERAGAIVIHGIAQLKVHSKITMIVRREPEGIRQYLHLGTGNYNEKTAKLYVDMGLLTVNRELGFDAARFFNAVLGYAEIPNLQHLVMAPTGLKRRLLVLIRREAERSSEHAPGLIIAKINSLADPDVIRALYDASQKGVVIKLNVRGICALLPGIPGVSAGIEVVSIIDRYLEHTRIFYFQNGGDDEVYLSSADWMPRNLEKRVELMFPLLEHALKERVLEMLRLYFRDNQKAHRLLPTGRSERIETSDPPVEAQRTLHDRSLEITERRDQERRRRLQVRRRPPGTK